MRKVRVPVTATRRRADRDEDCIRPRHGLGQLLHYGRELNAMEQVIGVMLVIVVIGLAADKALFAPWERFLHARWGTGARN